MEAVLRGIFFEFLFLSFAFFRFLLKFQLVTYSAVLVPGVRYSDCPFPGTPGAHRERFRPSSPPPALLTAHLR